MFFQASLIDATTAFNPGQAIENPPARSSGQTLDSTKALERARLLIDEIKSASYPELRGADVQVKLFESQADYFRARFAYPEFLTARRMRYIIFVNGGVFTSRAPEAGVRAIIAHELAHVLYFRQRNRLQLFGLVRLASKGFTARFERWADLHAIARGYGEGLKEYRGWLYQNVPAKRLGEKKRNYFSPEEIDAIVSATRKRPGLFAYWLKHVPATLKEIQTEDAGVKRQLFMSGSTGVVLP